MFMFMLEMDLAFCDYHVSYKSGNCTSACCVGRCYLSAMGKMRNCVMPNAEGKMRNGMCGATVIGRDVTSRDFIYSAFYHTLCVNCVEVHCILSMRNIAFCTLSVIGVVSPERSSSGAVPGISSRFLLGYMKVSGEPTPIMLSLPSRQTIFVSTACGDDGIVLLILAHRVELTHGVVIDATVFAAAPITTPCRIVPFAASVINYTEKAHIIPLFSS